MVNGGDLVQALPQLSDYAEIEVQEFSRIGSYHLTPEYWLQLARLINQRLKEDLTLAGIVITHGTDTIEETAFFLHLISDDARPILLTGAMKTADEISADGPANLLNSVRVAADLQSRGRGVMMVFNEKILSARDAWKSDNRSPETFQHTGFGYLGIVDPDGVKFYRNISYPHAIQPDFNLEEISVLPKVGILMDYTGFDESMLDYFAQQMPDGLVFQSMAGGRLSKGALEGIRNLPGNITVVISSKVPLGRITGDPNFGLKVIYARHLSTNRARILLMLGLTLTRDFQTLKGIFEQTDFAQSDFL